MKKKLDAIPPKGGTPNQAPESGTPNTLPRNRPCLKCGGVERTPAMVISETAFAGVEDGTPYTHIVRAVSRCQGCGQSRIERQVVDRAQGAADTVEI
jgi:hypothetical protein